MSLLYENATKKIFDDLYSKKAEDLARKWSGDRRINKPSQIRKFYDELVKYNDIVSRREEDFDDCKPLIKMLAAKAAYARGRGLVSDSFSNEFIKDLVSEIEEPQDLKNATLYFEAIVAFYKLYRPKD